MAPLLSEEICMSLRVCTLNYGPLTGRFGTYIKLDKNY